MTYLAKSEQCSVLTCPAIFILFKIQRLSLLHSDWIIQRAVTGMLISPQPDLLPDVFCLMVRIFRLILVFNSTNIPLIMIINKIYENQSSVAVACFLLVGLKTYQHPCNLLCTNMCQVFSAAFGMNVLACCLYVNQKLPLRAFFKQRSLFTCEWRCRTGDFTCICTVGLLRMASLCKPVLCIKKLTGSCRQCFLRLG